MDVDTSNSSLSWHYIATLGFPRNEYYVAFVPLFHSLKAGRTCTPGLRVGVQYCEQITMVSPIHRHTAWWLLA